MKKICVLTEHYYPDETATGNILAALAESLTEEYKVSVICAQPTYHQRGTTAAAEEVRRDVSIYRCASTRLDKNVIWKRVINLVTISWSIFLKACFHLRKRDIVLVVTNPPLLPFLAIFAARLRRTRIILLVHDVYPEVLVASGLRDENSKLVRIIQWANRRLYRGVDHVIVLGRDMEQLVRQKLGNSPVDVSIIPNWADIDQVCPTDRASNQMLQDHNLANKFVVQYAGNMGYVHDIETIVSAAGLLKDFRSAHFLFLGSGSKFDWLKKKIDDEELQNITLLPQRPRSEQNTFLNACDTAIIALLPGMLGVSVPSRTYNILAAGKPILAVLNAEAETALMIDEEDVGWVVHTQDPTALADKIRSIACQHTTVSELGLRARAVAEEKYTFQHALEQYRSVFGAVANE